MKARGYESDVMGPKIQFVEGPVYGSDGLRSVVRFN